MDRCKYFFNVPIINVELSLSYILLGKLIKAPKRECNMVCKPKQVGGKQAMIKKEIECLTCLDKKNLKYKKEK
ncbi:hypothetical protein D1631_12280 [Chryseobacterium nematophagum]|uniref:Uncharacterized protein n=1 Tax=Chryseobacterium nematophagum TaxID=2305228 RepID=A0A3M7TH88_9FLAO|nr:hypothetical protein D1631_12280 [Chryseobacterium nematophagum]